jgi:hypothetical protein
MMVPYGVSPSPPLCNVYVLFCPYYRQKRVTQPLLCSDRDPALLLDAHACLEENNALGDHGITNTWIQVPWCTFFPLQFFPWSFFTDCLALARNALPDRALSMLPPLILGRYMARHPHFVPSHQVQWDSVQPACSQPGRKTPRGNCRRVPSKGPYLCIQSFLFFLCPPVHL